MTKVEQIQSILGVTVDNQWGTQTQAALDALLHPQPQAPPVDGGKVDPRSEGNIATLHPRLQPLARKLIQQTASEGMTFKITSGTRTYAEQAELRKKYEAGGPKAARPGYSNHNFRLAFDITEFRNGAPVWESPNYTRAGMIGKELGLFWGGSWGGSDQDEPHFELRPPWAKNMNENMLIAELRRRNTISMDPFA